MGSEAPGAPAALRAERKVERVKSEEWRRGTADDADSTLGNGLSPLVTPLCRA